MEFTNNLAEAEEFDKLKTKVLKFVLYKKRTENEVREKFEQEIDEDKLEDIIEILKENKYIDDKDYIERSIKEYKALKSLSIKEINFKLQQKKVNKNLLDEYIYENREELLEFEIQSAKKILAKKVKSEDDLEDAKRYLYNKGYMSESVSIAIDELGEDDGDSK
ncbi:MAG: RecX family transcriptional regulator [Clostridia bacterium]|nr:RecX family transcriptional regulator [Clostridia bacterium]